MLLGKSVLFVITLKLGVSNIDSFSPLLSLWVLYESISCILFPIVFLASPCKINRFKPSDKEESGLPFFVKGNRSVQFVIKVYTKIFVCMLCFCTGHKNPRFILMSTLLILFTFMEHHENWKDSGNISHTKFQRHTKTRPRTETGHEWVT